MLMFIPEHADTLTFQNSMRTPLHTVLGQCSKYSRTVNGAPRPQYMNMRSLLNRVYVTSLWLGAH